MSQCTKKAEKNMYDAIISNNELYDHFIRPTAENTRFGYSPVDKNLLYSSLLEELVENDCHTRESFFKCLQTVICRLKTIRF